MFILNSYGKEILNADFVERFCVVEKQDAALIVASYNAERPPVTIGRYADAKEACGVLQEMLIALSSGDTICRMPESELYAYEKIKKDARTKRRGGS